LKDLIFKDWSLPKDLCLGSLVSLERLQLISCPGVEKIRAPLKLAIFEANPDLGDFIQIEFDDPSGPWSPAWNIFPFLQMLF